MTALLVCGLRREARLMKGAGVEVLVGGGDASGLASRLERRAAAGDVQALVSSGLAGALAPELGVGDVVLDGDPRLATALGQVLPEARRAPITGSDAAVASASDKLKLGRTTAAAAVDMETHVTAAVAARVGLPFAALRVISDPATLSLPPAALVAMRPDGGVATAAVLASLLRSPSQLPALLELARNVGTAFRSLARVHDLLRGRWALLVDPREFPLDMR